MYVYAKYPTLSSNFNFMVKYYYILCFNECTLFYYLMSSKIRIVSLKYLMKMKYHKMIYKWHEI